MRIALLLSGQPRFIEEGSEYILKNVCEGNNVDTSVLEAEMSRLAYEMSLEMVSILEDHLPAILESIAQDIRMKSDSAYKCSLLKDTKITDKECS